MSTLLSICVCFNAYSVLRNYTLFGSTLLLYQTLRNCRDWTTNFYWAVKDYVIGKYWLFCDTPLLFTTGRKPFRPFCWLSIHNARCKHILYILAGIFLLFLKLISLRFPRIFSISSSATYIKYLLIKKLLLF